jgi:hypothetical protein
MFDKDTLAFIMGQRKAAKNRAFQGRRGRFSDDVRNGVLDLLEVVMGLGGDVDDVSDIIGIHRSTIRNWFEDATEPTGIVININNVNINSKHLPDPGA